MVILEGCMSAGIYKLLYFRFNNLRRKLRAQIEYNFFFQESVIFSKYITAKKNQLFQVIGPGNFM